MFYGTDVEVTEKLLTARKAARKDRTKENHDAECGVSVREAESRVLRLERVRSSLL